METTTSLVRVVYCDCCDLALAIVDLPCMLVVYAGAAIPLIFAASLLLDQSDDPSSNVSVCRHKIAVVPGRN